VRKGNSAPPTAYCRIMPATSDPWGRDGEGRSEAAVALAVFTGFRTRLSEAGVSLDSVLEAMTELGKGGRAEVG
jgi:hypothetical protein